MIIVINYLVIIQFDIIAFNYKSFQDYKYNIFQLFPKP